jgi:hypothetical protein
VKICSFQRSVRNMPWTLWMPISSISSTITSPTPVLSTSVFVNLNVWSAFAVCPITSGYGVPSGNWCL